MLLGYARVSTDDQDLALQRASLKDAGCRKIFEEKVSGAKRARAELDRLLEHLRDGDVVVVSRLDRLARSTRDLLTLAEEIADRGAGLRWSRFIIALMMRRRHHARRRAGSPCAAR